VLSEPRSVPGSVGPARWFEAGPEAQLVLCGGRVERASARAIELLGHDPTGGDISDTFPDWHRSGDEDRLESTLRHDDGSEMPVEIRVARIEDGTAILSIRDARTLIAKRDAEAALAEAEERYRSLVEQIPAVVYADDGAVTTYVNPQIEEILGVSPEEYRDDPDLWMRMIHPDDRARVRAETDAFMKGHGGDLNDYRMVRPDGRLVWVRDRAYAHRDDEGHVVFEHGIMFDVTELKEAEARIAHMAFHDGLTGLANRAMFEETLVLAVERAKRDQHSAAVIYLDLDNFKLVNDSLGHHAGDRLLGALAERLSESTRDTDLVARQGGDEFLMLLADLDPDDVAAVVHIVTERIYAALEEPFDLNGSEFYVQGSIGVSVFPQDAADAEELLKNADIAMYRAKRVNPGGYAFFASDSEDAFDRLSFATRLRKAVEESDWVLHYQPIVDLSDSRVVGAEALIRWQASSGGIVPPGEFIPVAEELGLIEAIGEWVIHQAAVQQREWRDQGLELQLSFNLSPRELWTPRLVERIIGHFRDAGVEPWTMQAEITESMAMADPDRVLRMLRELNSWGLKLAIDDFGTGFSSLSRLKHMPVDVLKIDQEFVRNVDRDVRLAGMVRAMIQVAQSLDMVPLAEGVETEGEYIFLRANGCRLAQGFWFAHPVPADEFRELALRPAGLGAASQSV
jgi:diguanylate cyclase (GGDEF)-like protein/PAS domain S-box-containing protein